MSGYHLAQVNIGRLKAPLDAPATRDFVDNLEPINALADAQPGFVWRLTGEGDNATGIQAFDEPEMIINISTWKSLDDLAAFVYRTAHRGVMRRRREWFEPMDVYMALLWVRAKERPTPAEGRARVERLRALGPTAEDFTFRQPFPAPDGLSGLAPILDECA